MNNLSNKAGSSKFLSLVFLLFAVLGLLIRLVNIGNPLNDWDETTYALIARSLMSGELPYHGAFDHKPIALYYIFALFFQIFGYTLTAMRLMPFVAIGLTSWFLFRIAKERLPPHQHFLALCAIVFMATCTSFGNGGHASNTEILQMPIFAGWWLVLFNCQESSWRRSLLLGVLAGLAAQINYLGGFVLAVSTALMLVWPLLSNISRSTLRTFLIDGTLALGAFLVVAVIMLAPLIVAGDLPQYFRIQRAFLGGYQGVVNDEKLVRAVFSIAISACFFVTLFVCMVWYERSFRCLSRSSLGLLGKLLVVFAVTLFAIGLTKRLYPHYFNLLIVPSALILLVLMANASTRALSGFAYVAAMLALLLVARGAWDVYLKDWNGGFRQQHEIAELADEIRSHATTGERVLLLNLNHTLYFLADVVPATRFVFGNQMFADRFLSNIGSSPEQELITAMANRPVFVMACFDDIAADYRAMFEKKLAAGYREYSLPGYDECHELRAYERIAEVK